MVLHFQGTQKPNISIFQKPRTKVKEKPIRIRFRK